MNEITEFTKINFSLVFISVFIILSALKAAVTLAEYFISMAGIETKWMRRKQEDHKLLTETAHRLEDLNNKHEDDVRQTVINNLAIKTDLERLTKMFLEKEIDDIRWEILDFASSLSSGRSYSKEQFNHVLSIYNKYEKILEDNEMENGLVTASMDVIHEIYKEKLRTGFQA